MLDILPFEISNIEGEGSKPGSMGSAGVILMETRNEMKEAVGDMGPLRPPTSITFYY
jgi:hypothetical protein